MVLVTSTAMQITQDFRWRFAYLTDCTGTVVGGSSRTSDTGDAVSSSPSGTLSASERRAEFCRGAASCVGGVCASDGTTGAAPCSAWTATIPPEFSRPFFVAITRLFAAGRTVLELGPARCSRRGCRDVVYNRSKTLVLRDAGRGGAGCSGSVSKSITLSLSSALTGFSLETRTEELMANRRPPSRKNCDRPRPTTWWISHYLAIKMRFQLRTTFTPTLL